MTIQTREYIVKSFDEFTEKEQAKICDKYRYINVEDIEDFSNYDDIFIMNLEEQGFIDCNIFYDLSYSQGSGACFDCSSFNFDTLLSDFNCKHKKWIINILKDGCDVGIKKTSYSNHYSHEKTRYFELYFNSYHECKHIHKLLAQLEEHIEQKRLEACIKLYGDLQKVYNFLTSDEAIEETLLANEYLFNTNTLTID